MTYYANHTWAEENTEDTNAGGLTTFILGELGAKNANQ